METTHEVFNQPAPLVGYNLFETNRPLRDALTFNAPDLQTAACTIWVRRSAVPRCRRTRGLPMSARRSFTRTTALGGAST